MKYRPLRGLLLSASYTFAQKGWDYVYAGIGYTATGHPFLDGYIWQNKCVSLGAQYEIFNDIFIHADYSNRNIIDVGNTYTTEYFMGNTNTFSFGINWGF